MEASYLFNQYPLDEDLRYFKVIALKYYVLDVEF